MGVVVRGGRVGLLVVAAVVLILCGLGGGVGVPPSSSSLSLFAVFWAKVVVGRVGRVGGEEVVLKRDTELFRTVISWLVHKLYSVKQHWYSQFGHNSVNHTVVRPVSPSNFTCNASLQTTKVQSSLALALALVWVAFRDDDNFWYFNAMV